MNEKSVMRLEAVSFFVCLLSSVFCHPYSGGYSVGVPPLPIPNREVKPVRADGTAHPWESRSPPSFQEGKPFSLSRLEGFFVYVD